jgi:hypothetical protein
VRALVEEEEDGALAQHGGCGGSGGWGDAMGLGLGSRAGGVTRLDTAAVTETEGDGMDESCLRERRSSLIKRETETEEDAITDGWEHLLNGGAQPADLTSSDFNAAIVSGALHLHPSTVKKKKSVYTCMFENTAGDAVSWPAWRKWASGPVERRSSADRRAFLDPFETASRPKLSRPRSAPYLRCISPTPL